MLSTMRFSPDKVIQRSRLIAAVALFVIVPIIIVSLATYSAARESLLTEIEAANANLMRQIQERTDQIFDTVDRSVSQHMTDNQLAILLREGKLQGNELELQHVFDTLASMETLIEYVDAAYLYMVKEDALLSVNGVWEDPEAWLGTDFYHRLLDNQQLSFWHEELTGELGLNDAAPMSLLGGVTYARKLPAALSEPAGYYVVRLEGSALQDIFDPTTLGGPQHGVMAVSPQGNLYASSELLERMEVQELLAPILSWIETTVKEQARPAPTLMNTAIHHTLLYGWPSIDSGWTYISIQSYEELLESVQHVRLIAIATCLLVAGLAMGFSLLWSHLTYGRVKHAMEYLYSENKLLAQKVLEELPERHLYWVSKWLQEPLNEEDIRRMAALDMPIEGFAYTAFSFVRNPSVPEPDDSPLDWDHVVDRIRGIVPAQPPASLIQVYQTRIGPDSIGGVFVQDYGEHQRLRADLIPYVREWMDVLRLQLGLSLSIGIGGTGNVAADVNLSFKQAQRSLTRRLIYPEQRVFVMDETSMERMPIYPYEEERILIMQLRLGDASGASAALNDFTERLLAAKTLTDTQVRSAFSLLLSSIMRAVPEHPRMASDLLQPVALQEKVFELHTLPELSAWLKQEVFSALIAHHKRMNSPQMSSEESPVEIVRQVQEHIRTHYEETLSLTLLADRFGLTEAQLSQQFRKVTGVSLTDYIIAVRIDKAKELLSFTELKVADIASRMQYNNAQNFIRVFKRITGMTPGEFRKSSELAQ